MSLELEEKETLESESLPSDVDADANADNDEGSREKSLPQKVRGNLALILDLSMVRLHCLGCPAMKS